MFWRRMLLATLFSCTWLVFFYWFLSTPSADSNSHRVQQRQRQYNHSTARCVGSTFTTGKEWFYRSCHFQNVCYDGNAGSRLLFYSHPADDRRSASELSVGSMVPYVQDGRAPVREQSVMLKMGTQIPKDAVWPHGDEEVITSLMNWFIPSVWSHLLMDNIYPIYRLMDIFSLDTNLEVEPLFMDDLCPGQPGCGTSGKYYRHQFTELLSPKHKWPLLRLADKYPNRTVCFEHVIVGPSLFSDHMMGDSLHGRVHNKPDWTNWGIGGTMARFREFIVRRAGVDPHAPRQHDVVFLSKGQLAWLNNGIDLGPIVRKFNQTHSGLRVLSGIRMENMTVQDQIELAVRSKVIVAQEGSTSFGALWMQPGSTLIIIGTEWLDSFMWGNLAHIQVRFFRPTQVTEIVQSIESGLLRQ